MIVYYSVFGLLLLLKQGIRRGAGYWAVLLALILFAGFRYEVGCDWNGYLANWTQSIGEPLNTVIQNGEPAHWTAIALLQDAGLSYTYLLVVASVIFFTGFSVLARRQPNPYAMLVLAFPILIINMPMSGIRQAEAVGIMCVAFAAFIDRRMMRFIALVLLAFLFHRSAVVFLFLAPLIPGRLDKKNIALAALLSLPGVYFVLQSSAADLATSRYVDTGVDAAGASFRLMILSLSGVFYLWKLAPKWRDQFPEDYKLVTIGAWMMVAFFGLFFVASVIGDRFGYYLIPLQLMIFTRIPYIQGLKDRRLWKAAPYVALSIVFFVWTQFSWHFQQCYVPYQFGVYALN